jgi:hypothetical protein
MGQPRTINLFLSKWVSPEELFSIDNGWAEKLISIGNGAAQNN